MEFTPINTQEEFDARVTELYGDVKNLKKQITTLTGERDGHAQTISSLQATIKGHEATALRHKIAHEKGIPFEMASRLTGETEEDIRKDAEAVAKFLAKPYEPAPLAQIEPTADPKSADMTSMLHELRGE